MARSLEGRKEEKEMRRRRVAALTAVGRECWRSFWSFGRSFVVKLFHAFVAGLSFFFMFQGGIKNDEFWLNCCLVGEKERVFWGLKEDWRKVFASM